MHIQYCSDLHLEFQENTDWLQQHPLLPQADILIIAGDLVPLKQLQQHLEQLEELCEPYQQVYWIPGNHEFYYEDISHWQGSYEKQVLPNLTLLNNRSVTIGHVELIFTTLWTHVSPVKAAAVQSRLSDFYLISNQDRALDITAYNKLHLASLEFLHHALENSQDKTQIVITHHCPTFRNYPLQYAGSPINEAFAVELEEMILNTQPEYWIYGHTHINTPAFQLGNTRMLTNQLGYVRRNEHYHFLADAVLELR